MRPEYEIKSLIKVNNRDVMATISVYVELETDIDLFIGDLDQEQIEREIESGALMVVSLLVEATACGCTGFDSLSGCFIRSRADIDSIIAEHSMHANACADLENILAEQYADLKTIFG